MTPDDLVEIRSRAEASPLGMQVARALDQGILDRRALLAEVNRLQAQVTAVRDLHQPAPDSATALSPEPLCKACPYEYPCPTTQALDTPPPPDPPAPLDPFDN